ncbi:MAG: hypothetical protein Q8882_00620 [Bacillota bacterium]|nr:hypothetical protein [Bacillota bacterium]
MKNNNKKWLRLDNAAKIYPATKRKNWSNVFRLSISLKEDIDVTVLQKAVDTTIKRFPSIAVCLKRGFFWFYLEQVEKAPKVQAEKPYPCSQMSYKEMKKCSFRVLYYKNRIAIEFFHALTDGNGGLVFLKTLAAEYITQKYGTIVENVDGVLNREDVPKDEEIEDSFLKYDGEVSKSRKEKTAYKLKGTGEESGYRNLITGILDVNEVLAKAKEYKVSLTTFIASVMIYVIEEIQKQDIPQRKKQKPVKVLIPVNLRNFFNSASLRNFVLFITPGINPKLGEYSFDEIVRSVHHEMGFELTSKQMGSRITKNVKAEKLLVLKLTPLFIKNVVMKAVYKTVGEKKSCITLSNLGAVTLPCNMKKYVSRIDFVLGVQATCPNNCGILSYNGKLYINFIRNIKEPTLERKFFTFLKEMGLDVEIESNQKD